MKLHKILKDAKVLSGELWFRPSTWQNTGTAFTVIAGRVYTVPSATGGDIGMTASVEMLAGKWTLVHPDVVCSELEKLQL